MKHNARVSRSNMLVLLETLIKEKGKASQIIDADHVKVLSIDDKFFVVQLGDFGLEKTVQWAVFQSSHDAIEYASLMTTSDSTESFAVQFCSQTDLDRYYHKK